MEHLHGYDCCRAANPERQQVKRGTAFGNIRRLTPANFMQDSVVTVAAEPGIIHVNIACHLNGSSGGGIYNRSNHYQGTARYPEPCFEGGTAVSYQRQVATKANAPDTSTLGCCHADEFTRQTIKTGRTVTQSRSDPCINGGSQHWFCTDEE